jgi:hypothetical protein
MNNAEQSKLLIVHYEQRYESGGQICEGEEGDTWPNREDEYNSFTVLSAGRRVRDPYHDGLSQPAVGFPLDKPFSSNRCYIVWVRYSTGDTFGSSHGHGSIAGAYLSRAEAEVCALAIKNKTAPFDGWRDDWCGYFESIEEVVIDYVPLYDD